MLYTHDVGPRITAKQLGIITKELREGDKLPPQKDENEQENDRLKRELHDLQSAAPQLTLAINNERETISVATLSTPPEPLEEADIERAAAAALDALPVFARPTTTDDEPQPIVTNAEGRRVLRLDLIGPSALDPSAISRHEYGAYDKRRTAYKEEYREYLRGHQQSTEERSRTIRLDFTLHNNGGKPGEEIRIDVIVPEHVTTSTELPVSPGLPKKPPLPRTNAEVMTESLSRIAVSPYGSFPALPNMNPAQTGPDIDGCTISWWVRRLRHGYSSELGHVYITLRVPIQPFTSLLRTIGGQARIPHSFIFNSTHRSHRETLRCEFRRERHSE